MPAQACWPERAKVAEQRKIRAQLGSTRGEEGKGSDATTSKTDSVNTKPTAHAARAAEGSDTASFAACGEKFLGSSFRPKGEKKLGGTGKQLQGHPLASSSSLMPLPFPQARISGPVVPFPFLATTQTEKNPLYDTLVLPGVVC